MIKSKTFRANSFTSLIASALVFITSLAIPGILARTINVHDYSYYNIVLSFLPFVLIPSFALRSISGSALIFLQRNTDGFSQMRAWLGAVLTSIAIPFVAIIVLLIFVQTRFFFADSRLVYWSCFGAVCLFVYIIGITIALFISGPASASHNFIPENLLKFGPGLTQLLTLTFLYSSELRSSLEWIFVIFGFSSWPIAIALIFIYWRKVKAYFSAMTKDINSTKISPYKFLFISTISMMWWHLSTWLATSASITTAAAVDPKRAVAFSMAYSLIGIISGGLIAISSPVASKIASLSRSDPSIILPLFVKMNRYFYVYIFTMAFIAFLTPTIFYEYWVGSIYADDVQTFIRLLIPSTILRLLITGYTLFIMGLSAQSRLWLSPFVEATCAISASVLFAYNFGIEGICYGLIISALVRLSTTLMYDRIATQDILPLRVHHFL